MVLIIPFAWLCIIGQDMAALGVFLVAGVTDALDGHLARRFGQSSMWGRLADPWADKLLTTTAYLVLSIFRSPLPAIPVWLTVSVILRDIFILVGALVVYLLARSSGFKPTVSGKINTFLEIGVVVWFLVSSRLPVIAPMLPVWYVLLLGSLILSGGDYMLQGVRMVREAHRH